MIILGFCDKTSKILPRLVCRKFRHVAVIDIHENNLTLYQFVRYKKIAIIHLKWRDLKILGQYGWKFVLVPCALPQRLSEQRAWTCVAFAKHAISMRNMRVQTPDGLYKKIKNI